MGRIAKGGIIVAVIMVIMTAPLGIPGIVFGFRAIGTNCEDLAIWLIIASFSTIGIVIIQTPFIVLVFNGVGKIRTSILVLSTLFFFGWAIYGAIIAWSATNDRHCRYGNGRPVWILSTIHIIGMLLKTISSKDVKKSLNDEEFLPES